MMPRVQRFWWLTWLAIVLVVATLSWWSYQLVDPNLTLVNQDWFVQWQAGMWARGRDFMAVAWQYVLLMGLWWFGYIGLLAVIPKQESRFKPRWMLVALVVVGTIALLGHNATSHDIFNYLFNAKMVLQYGADPHVKVALDFAFDPWVRFMHNTHTAAPYGYGWTIVSLLPLALSMGKFLLAYLFMKLWIGLGLILLLYFLYKVVEHSFPQEKWQRWLLVAAHPLLIFETLMVGHNDVWMMWPMLAAVWWRLRRHHLTWLDRLLIVSLFVLSVSIKLATVVFLPILVWWLVPGLAQSVTKLAKRQPIIAWAVKQLELYWPEWVALGMALLLLTPRSQQFHPWYFIWILPLLALMRVRWWQATLLGLSVTASFRYVPWLLAALEYNPTVQWQMRVITWSGALVGCASWWAYRFIVRGRK